MPAEAVDQGGNVFTLVLLLPAEQLAFADGILWRVTVVEPGNEPGRGQARLVVLLHDPGFSVCFFPLLACVLQNVLMRKLLATMQGLRFLRK